ncbi:MAG: hypothetical protein PWR01_2151 [Clostridiales bacterium]|nr:hypothetical protein [Clostridiales bacterium]MDN5281078.1 hypothetical protein [Candidatus Ozemobacter sp.]
MALFVVISIIITISGCQDKTSKIPVSAIVTEDNWQTLTSTDQTSDGQTASSSHSLTSFRVLGYIYDKNSRQPVANVFVNLDLNGVTKLTTRSTSAGMFIFEGIPPGLYDVVTTASPANYLPTNHVVRILQDGSASPDQLEVLLVPVSTTAPGQVTYTIEGEARDEISGAPAANEFVKLFDESGALLSTSLTDSQGNFSFSGAVPGSYTIEIAKGSDKYFEKTFEINLGSDGKVVPAAILLLSDKTVETSVIEGVIRHGSSQEVLGGITVQLRQTSPTAPVLSTQISNGEGKFYFENLLPGTYFLTAAPASEKFEPETYIITILRDGTVSPELASIFIIPKAVETQTFTISGNVLDAFSGSPLDFVTCTLKEVGPIITDLNGIFYFEQLVEGDYQLNLVKAGFNSQTVNFKVDASGQTIPASLTFRMVYNQEQNKGSIVGRICDVFTGQGLPDLIVRVYKMERRVVNIDDSSISYWSIDDRPLKTTKTHSTSIHPDTGFDETGTFKLTHLEPTSDSVKYLVYVGKGISGIWLTSVFEEDLTNPDRIESWGLVEVLPDTSTYLVNYEPTN